MRLFVDTSIAAIITVMIALLLNMMAIKQSLASNATRLEQLESSYRIVEE